MRCRPVLRAALFVALACSFAGVCIGQARADIVCGVQVRHFPAPGTEAPGTFDIALVAESPQSVAAEWEAYTDRGFLRATLPPVQLAASGTRSPVLLAAHSPTIVIRIPDGAHVYESWLRTVGSDTCAPPAGDPTHGPTFRGTMRETIPTPGPADRAVDAVVAPDLERLDCASPFADPRPVTIMPPQYPKGVLGSGGSLVEIRVGPDGRVVEGSIYRSSGNVRFDEAALSAVARSTFTAPVAFCRPTFGNYIFHVDFP